MQFYKMLKNMMTASLIWKTTALMALGEAMLLILHKAFEGNLRVRQDTENHLVKLTDQQARLKSK